MRQVEMSRRDALARLAEGESEPVTLRVSAARHSADAAHDDGDGGGDTGGASAASPLFQRVSGACPAVALLLRRLRLPCGRWCPAGVRGCCGDVLLVLRFVLLAVRLLVVSACRLPVRCAGAAWHGLPPSGPRRRVALCALGVVVAVAVAAAAMVLWAACSLWADPYAALRIRLAAAYPAASVEDYVSVVRSRRGAHLVDSDRDYDYLVTESARGACVRARVWLEKQMLSMLTAVLVMTSADAKATAEGIVSQLWAELKTPIRPMLGEHRSVDDSGSVADKGVGSVAATRMTVEKRMLSVARAAVLRCTHGVPTLPPPSGATAASPGGSAARFDSLWSAFAGANAVLAAQPRCLARGQHRMPCADVGDAAAREGSRVQHLYEHGRVGVARETIAALFYESTPALRELEGAPDEATEDPDADVSGVAEDAELGARVRMQAERFRRASPAESGEALKPFSGVIMFLAGAGNRSPKRRNNVFTEHTLRLLETNYLSQYPHYPVHVFYEAAAAKSKSARKRWTLPEVLRLSDVHTIYHTYDASNATRVSSGGQLVHVAPPPPVIVESASVLPAMRARNAGAAKWFNHVASRVPSAPYVTFENILPLFSTLPCGVTEGDVRSWVKNKRVSRVHRRGYRQMCRFWAKLVWHLPSLRVWTDSAEGRSEMLAYGAAEADASPLELPPWRYRYTYYMRLDTDSYLFNAMACDPFVTMAVQRCAYGFNSLVEDAETVTISFGHALTEWMDDRTSISSGELEAEMASVNLSSVDKWGRLTDPALSTIATLTTQATESGELGSVLPPLPPLPPTWPWANVYPEHSSVALSAAEKDVLRAYFFSNEGSESKAFKAGSQAATETPYETLPPGFAVDASYNRAMYFNNFELGTFALKTHPLYMSATDFFDNRDYDDVPAVVREAAAGSYTLRRWGADGSAAAPAKRKRALANSVYILERAAADVPRDGEGAAAASKPVGGDAAGRCRGRRINGTLGIDPDMAVAAHRLRRDWRSGYLQYRWGDAPVHTFGVEVAMQREGWAVCQFAEDLGGYAHGEYRTR